MLGFPTHMGGIAGLAEELVPRFQLVGLALANDGPFLAWCTASSAHQVGLGVAPNALPPVPGSIWVCLMLSPPLLTPLLGL